jgi:biotin carboxyl carrier protein
MTANDSRRNEPGSKENTVSELKILNIRGELYHTRLTGKFEHKPKWKKPDKKHLVSFIPGTICQVFVQPGDLVDTSSKLMILEAMKMQNVIYSPIAGRIKSVLVKEGEKVRKGDLMAEFE